MAKKKTPPPAETPPEAPQETALVPEGQQATSMLEVDIDRGRLSFSRFFAVTPTALIVTGQPSLERCGEMGGFLHIVEKSLQWAVGDFANWVEAQYGEEAAQVLDQEHFSESSLRVYQWVAAKVPPENRRADLWFGHHQEVASLMPDQQQGWLQKAVDGDDGAAWSVGRLRKEIKASGGPPAAVTYTVTVTVDSPDQQEALIRQLANLGYEKCKKQP